MEFGVQERHPFWNWTDFLLFLSAVLPCFALSFGALRLLIAAAPKIFGTLTITTLTLQSLMYICLLGALRLVIGTRYHRPLFESLNWNRPIPQPLSLVLAGPVLAIGLSSLGVLLHAPMINSGIEKLITSRATLILMTVFGVAFAPVVEELLFRGFLFPLLARTFGPSLGILLTAIPFALLHGAQNEWAWQQVTLIGIAGAAFGYVRHKTGSTAASALLHAAYNLTGFGGYMLTHWTLLR